VIVNDPKVSRFHAQIRYENGQFVVYDVSSTNGIRVNGVRAPRPVPLRPNDTLGVGSHEFIFQRR
jgi:pSer/pThr/pTyr-binding forkhead associated (FHA) protein